MAPGDKPSGGRTVAQFPNRVNNIVLVHGAWADGSGWEGVYKILAAKGYHVTVVPNPNTSLAEDVRITKAVLAMADGPEILRLDIPTAAPSLQKREIHPTLQVWYMWRRSRRMRESPY